MAKVVKRDPHGLYPGDPTLSEVKVFWVRPADGNRYLVPKIDYTVNCGHTNGFPCGWCGARWASTGVVTSVTHAIS